METLKENEFDYFLEHLKEMRTINEITYPDGSIGELNKGVLVIL